MAKYVPDITTDRWVIVAEGRTKRPVDADKKPASNVNPICVFCPGFERIPGEEISRIGEGMPYERGWQVRVIKNKYPITDFHEVIIHSPDHEQDIDKLPISATEAILKAYRLRFNANIDNGHVIIFNNVGEVAGASLGHPHSQLVVVPKQINLDSLKLEPIVNEILDNEHFVVFCPEFSQWPFEIWIAPKVRNQYFGEVSDAQIEALAPLLQQTISKMLFHLDTAKHYHPGLPMISFKHGPAYNFYLSHQKDWYLRIVPRLVHRAGFELGTGLSVNIIDPADAALILSQDINNDEHKKEEDF